MIVLDPLAEVTKRFKRKIEELVQQLPKKYTEGKIISQNCAMLTIKSFLEIIGIENQNCINMGGPLAAITGVCGAVNAGLMVVGLIIGENGKIEVHQLKAAAEGMRFLKEFKKVFGAIECHTLTGGYNLLRMDEMKRYLRDMIWETKCYRHVVVTNEIIGRLYKKQLAKLIYQGSLERPNL